MYYYSTYISIISYNVNMQKPFFERLFGHFKTITRHKLEVQKLCFKCGLVKQGLLHDLSKYSPTEFNAGVKYFQGYRSPIDAEKEDIGYSLAWLHHKGRNKHHFEYWMDKKLKSTEIIFYDMPMNYLIESCCDKIAASKIYNGDSYKDEDPYNFYFKGTDRHVMNPETSRKYGVLLEYLKENGENKTLCYYKELYKKWKKDKNFTI